MNFYPLDYVSGLTYDYPDTVHKDDFKRKGVGTVCHIKILYKLLLQSSPERNFMVESSGTLIERKNHLSAMGISLPTSFEEYVIKSFRYANSKGFAFEIPPF